MKTNYFIPTFLLTISLCACTSNGDKKAPNQVKTMLIVNEQCLLTKNRDLEINDKGGAGFIATLGAALLPKIIGYGFDLIKKRVTEVRKTESSGKVYGHLYQSTPYHNYYEKSKVGDSSDKQGFKLDADGNRVPTPFFQSMLTSLNGDSSIDTDEILKNKEITGQVGTPVQNKNISCITVLTGRFNGALPTQVIGDVFEGDKNSEVTVDDVVNILNANGIKTSSEDFYSAYEFSIESEGKVGDKIPPNTFRIHDHLLLVNKLINGEKKAGLVYTTTIAGPGKTEDGTTYTTIVKDFGKVGVNTQKMPTDFNNPTSGYFSKIGITKEELARVSAESDAKIEEKRDYMPVKIETVMTQTVKPSESAKFIGSLLDATNTVVSEHLNDKFFPADTTIEVYTAKVALQKAVIALAKADDDNAKILAQLEYDKACAQLTKLNKVCVI